MIIEKFCSVKYLFQISVHRQASCSRNESKDELSSNTTPRVAFRIIHPFTSSAPNSGLLPRIRAAAPAAMAAAIDVPDW